MFPYRTEQVTGKLLPYLLDADNQSVQMDLQLVKSIFLRTVSGYMTVSVTAVLSACVMNV